MMCLDLKLDYQKNQKLDYQKNQKSRSEIPHDVVFGNLLLGDATIYALLYDTCSTAVFQSKCTDFLFTCM